MSNVYESFYIEGNKVGGIVRILESHKLSTLTCFQVPNGPLIHLEHRFFFSNTLFDWTKYEFNEYHENKTTYVIRNKDQILDVSGNLIQNITWNSIPSYAAYLILKELITDNKKRAIVNLIVDGNPNAKIDAAEFACGEIQKLVLPTGERISATAVPLMVNKKSTNTHWITHDKIIKSDWQGAESYHVSNLNELIEGLEPRVSNIIKSFQ